MGLNVAEGYSWLYARIGIIATNLDNSPPRPIPATIDTSPIIDNREVVLGEGSEEALEFRVLFGKFQKHRLIKELVDTHIFAEALAPTRLHHEFPGQCLGW